MTIKFKTIDNPTKEKETSLDDVFAPEPNSMLSKLEQCITEVNLYEQREKIELKEKEPIFDTPSTSKKNKHKKQ